MTVPAEPLFIDLETRSTVDLRDTGVHVYAEDPSTEVLLARFCIGDGPMHEWELGHSPHPFYQDHVARGGTLVAHNAEFERVVIREVLGPRYGWNVPSYEQWECTAAMASAMALPRSLEAVGKALGLPVQKDVTGRRLMLKMTKPRKVHDDGTVTWWESAADLAALGDYCAIDVETTRAAYARLRPLPPAEREAWLLDARMNDRGVYVDAATVKAAKEVIAGAEAAALAELRLITLGRVETAKQVAKFRDWLGENGLELPDLARGTVEAAMAVALHPPHVQRALEIRLEISKSSTSKLDAMLNRRCRDGRARGNLVYHAATTGRWAGTGIQMQNLPRGTIENAERCLPAIQTGEWQAVEALWGLPRDDANYQKQTPFAVVSSAIRSMFMAAPGNDLIAADFSNIEGRVLAWLAGEAWKLDAFRDYDAGTGPDLYKLAFAKSFGVHVGSVTKDQRQLGKVQELALGYQGGVGAFLNMARVYGMSVPEAKADELKVAWRNAHPQTVAFWYDLERAARAAIRTPGQKFSAGDGKITFGCAAGFLWARLPSGRLLAYPAPSVVPELGPGGRPRDVITFQTVNPVTHQFEPFTTYGGKLAENVTQAVARDLMRDALLRLEAAGYPQILSVHDESVGEVPEGFGSVEEYEQIMSASEGWAAGLPVAAEGWRGKRYRK